MTPPDYERALPAESFHGKLTRALIILLMLLTAAHLLLSAIEILYRPVFPWDAWLNWMYRAKAWYLSGGITDFDPASLWAAGQEPQHAYALAGHHYPPLLPLIAYATATLLGGWSETLVNLPVLLCGVAIALGTYSLSRRHGHSALISTMIVYLVVSTPLLGAHLSLAGMADIWMAMFCGVGFIALCSGLIRRASATWITGLLLVAVSTQIKVEGTVWLLAALLLVVATLLPRISAALLCVMTLAVGGLYIAGMGGLEVPVLGKVGIFNDRLHVPLLGSFALQRYELTDDYLSNFFLSGTWNLTWYLLALAAVAALVSAACSRQSRIFLLFFALVFAAQAVIFVFTEQGAWAEDWTAINRLPLHFLPALLFCGVCLLTGGSPEQSGSPDSSRQAPEGSGGFSAIAWTTLLAGLGVFLIAAIVLSALSEYVPGRSLHLDANALKVMVGEGRKENGWLAVERFEDNIAVVSSGPITADTAKGNIIHVETRGSNEQKVTLFWRNRESGALLRTSVAGLGSLYIDLSKTGDWKGKISEMGVILYDDGRDAAIKRIELLRPSLITTVRQWINDWRWVPPWSLRSVNWMPAGNPRAAIALPAIIVLLALLVFLAGGFRAPGSMQSRLTGAFLGAWLIFDTSWVYQRTVNAARTIADYDAGASSALAFGDDDISRSAVRRALCDQVTGWRRRAETQPGRLIITDDNDADMQFQLYRAKYHALPAPVHVHAGRMASLPRRLGDRVLVLKQRYGREAARARSTAEIVDAVTQRTGLSVRVAWESADASLLLLDDNAQDAACWRAGRP